jgi:hypothetical protein
MTFEQLKAEVLKLPLRQRAHPAERLLSTLDEDSETEQAWAGVAERRYQQYLAGEMATISASEAFAEICAELKR